MYTCKRKIFKSKMSTLVMYNNSRAQKEDSVNTQYREYNESYIFFKLSTLNSYFSFFIATSVQIVSRPCICCRLLPQSYHADIT